MKYPLRQLSHKALGYALGTAIIFSAIFYFGWKSDQQQLKHARIQTVESASDLLTELIQEMVNENLQMLLNHTRRVEHSKGDYFNQFSFETDLVLSVKDAITFIEWIDGDGVIRLIEPLEENREAIGLNILNLPYREPDWRQMKRDSTINFTPWTILVQGRGAFLVDVPIYYENEFHGSLTAGMDFTNELKSIMAGREIFHLQIWDDNGYRFFDYGEPASDAGHDLRVDRTLTFDDGSGLEWLMRLTVNDNLYSERAILMSQLGLTFRILFAGIFGALIYFMATTIRKSRDNAKALKEKEVLISEIHHRVKNNLAVISSLIEMQTLEVESEDTLQILKKTQNRIHSIAGVHELLYQSESLSDIPFESYLEKLLNHHFSVYKQAGDEISYTILCDEKKLNINQAIPLGMLLSELITNSFKHAFKHERRGEIIIDIREEAGWLTVIYTDNGIGFDTQKLMKGEKMGSVIIQTLISQLEAEVEMTSDNGFRMQLRFEQE
jgi:two-component sensor histidine kinase/sensor domain CHASE-containing protein